MRSTINVSLLNFYMQIFSSGDTSRTQNSSNCSVTKGNTEAIRLIYVNEKDREKERDRRQGESIKSEKITTKVKKVVRGK